MMYKKILEFLIFSILFFSPLLHVSIEDSTATRTMWSGLIVVSVLLIIFFATYLFRVQSFSRSFLIWISVLYAASFFLATYHVHAFAIYLATLALFILFAVNTIVSKDPRRKIIFIAMLLGFFALYAQWGIIQFIVQHDIGMKRIGESVLTPNISGIASFYIGSEKFIRAYGPFGHSNSFAGVLLLGIMLLYRHARKFQSPLFLQGIAFIVSLGIIVSFSRTAIIGLIAIGLFAIYKRNIHTLLPLATAALLFIPLFLRRSLDTHGAAVSDRLEGLGWFMRILNFETLIRGVGLGNYTGTLAQYLENNAITFNPWDIAPIHSVPLFVTAELGLLVCIPLAIFIVRFLRAYKLWVLIVLAPALFLDHYFATQLAPFIFLITSARLVV